MDNLRVEIKQFLLSWLDLYWPGDTQLEFEILVLMWLVLFAMFLHILLHGFVIRLITRRARKTGRRWQKLLVTHNLFRRAAWVFQGAVVQIQATLWLDESPSLLRSIVTISDQWILLFGLLMFFSLLDFFQSLLQTRLHQINFPLRGVIQTIKLIASVFVAVLAISILMGKSPLIWLSGLGALSAVLMLVFKDPLLGLVAGIQLSANEMLSVGDWLEMPRYGADGDVIDIGLTTVKVQNWDKTISTIPTYALISDSFKNWRGMTEVGGRRIKRSVFINTSSILFLDNAMLERLKKAELLDQYLSEKSRVIDSANSRNQTDMSVRINGRRLTNIGTFRGYLVSYLQSHPDIHQQMTLMVRQLHPTSEGLPIEIYAFTNTTSWEAYEDIQSDIFDHVFAVLSEFGLRVHESPTGYDIRELTRHQEITEITTHPG